MKAWRYEGRQSQLDLATHCTMASAFTLTVEQVEPVRSGLVSTIR